MCMPPATGNRFSEAGIPLNVSATLVWKSGARAFLECAFDRAPAQHLEVKLQLSCTALLQSWPASVKAASCIEQRCTSSNDGFVWQSALDVHLLGGLTNSQPQLLPLAGRGRRRDDGAKRLCHPRQRGRLLL